MIAAPGPLASEHPSLRLTTPLKTTAASTSSLTTLSIGIAPAATLKRPPPSPPSAARAPRAKIVKLSSATTPAAAAMYTLPSPAAAYTSFSVALGTACTASSSSVEGLNTFKTSPSSLTFPTHLTMDDDEDGSNDTAMISSTDTAVDTDTPTLSYLDALREPAPIQYTPYASCATFYSNIASHDTLPSPTPLSSPGASGSMNQFRTQRERRRALLARAPTPCAYTSLPPLPKSSTTLKLVNARTPSKSKPAQRPFTRRRSPLCPLNVADEEAPRGSGIQAEEFRADDNEEPRRRFPRSRPAPNLYRSALRTWMRNRQMEVEEARRAELVKERVQTGPCSFWSAGVASIPTPGFGDEFGVLGATRELEGIVGRGWEDEDPFRKEEDVEEEQDGEDMNDEEAEPFLLRCVASDSGLYELAAESDADMQSRTEAYGEMDLIGGVVDDAEMETDETMEKMCMEVDVGFSTSPNLATTTEASIDEQAATCSSTPTLPSPALATPSTSSDASSLYSHRTACVASLCLPLALQQRTDAEDDDDDGDFDHVEDVGEEEEELSFAPLTQARLGLAPAASRLWGRGRGWAPDLRMAMGMRMVGVGA